MNHVVTIVCCNQFNNPVHVVQIYANVRVCMCVCVWVGVWVGGCVCVCPLIEAPAQLLCPALFMGRISQADGKGSQGQRKYRWLWREFWWAEVVFSLYDRLGKTLQFWVLTCFDTLMFVSNCFMMFQDISGHHPNPEKVGSRIWTIPWLHGGRGLLGRPWQYVRQCKCQRLKEARSDGTRLCSKEVGIWFDHE